MGVYIYVNISLKGQIQVCINISIITHGLLCIKPNEYRLLLYTEDFLLLSIDFLTRDIPHNTRINDSEICE